MTKISKVCRPSQSSWGYKGFHEYWLNETNAWIYPHLHKGTERMIELSHHEAEDELQERALNQAARELLLAQSSDWAFIMRTGLLCEPVRWFPMLSGALVPTCCG